MAEVKTSGRPIDQLLEKVLCMNILSSDYFRDLLRLKTYHEVIDEIYNQVDHVEPWMTGNCRGPSTAFCLLYKFFTMKLTVKQMHGLLKHPDSPYIRAVGFLYLRYLADFKTLWSWYEPYLKDDEEFSPGSSGKMTTMGVYVRDLFLGQYYFDTLLPRIPVPVMRAAVANLEKMNLPTKLSGSTGDSSRGSEETSRRPPSVKASLSVSFGQRAPHRASTRDSSPVRRAGTERGTRKEQGTETVIGIGIGIGIEIGIGTRIEKGRGAGIGIEIGGMMKGIETGGVIMTEIEEGSVERSRRSRSRSRSHSQSLHDQGANLDQQRTPPRDESKEKRAPSTSSNLAKLKDLYGDLGSQKENVGDYDRAPNRDSSTEEVIRLGGSWR
ncbi:pre-mRNA splicing factor SR-like 1 isoform X5 [Lycium ferocissimum]|uniref:pre-mRNA splicing factor SR-like 1 isoform X5 n=1 Tax=Lycium ferocissimum TaxID=112874 RepID=UPI002814EA82|nr:pre-mRNA splicing factor SR-like 1 isoform X5 [Lycium ferocissimum]